MRRITGEEIKEILGKAEKRLGRSIELDEMEHFPGDSFSQEYEIFRRENLERYVSRYEKLCRFAERTLRVKPKEKDREKIQGAIDIAHLDMTVEGATSFAAILVFLIVLLGVFSGVGMYLFSGDAVGFFSPEGGLKSVSLGVVFIPLIIVLFGALLMGLLSKYPLRIAARWRLRASNQMVLCILYMVMYMRHTSNLEHAIKFAGEHVGAPLALDLRKILWDVENGKFMSIKESLDSYLVGWKDHSLEFVESMHLIEGSLYEPSDERRIGQLEKALEVILNGTYEKMLHYAHDLRSPITMVYMLGVILPVLGLVVFPLMSGFLEGLVKWWHLALLYNLFLPVFVYFYGMNLLEKRPTGYGSEDILKEHPEFEEFTKMKVGGMGFSPGMFALFIGGILVIIGLIPLLLFYATPQGFDYTLFEGSILESKLLDYKCDETCIGPYSVFSMILSLFIPLGIALGIGTYYYIWSKQLIRIRKRTSDMEREFSGAIFQLGNRVGDGLPVERAISSVAENVQGTPSGDFLRMTDANIRKMGMSVKDAIFDSHRGSIVYFPSNLIKSSMKVLVESAKKGPQIVAKSLITISDYVNRVRSITERLKDLLADILSSMKGQITFLTPMIAGIVVGVTSMMISIINNLTLILSEMGDQEGAAAAGFGGFENITKILTITDIIPGYQFQIVVGLFVVEVVIILSILSSGIENGIDRVTHRYVIGRNLFIAVGLYFLIALISIVIFSVLAGGVVQVARGTGV
ncbi:MAG: hypothetical protein ABIB47_05895 [Candidatus Woesearchaeota archaeon]